MCAEGIASACKAAKNLDACSKQEECAAGRNQYSTELCCQPSLREPADCSPRTAEAFASIIACCGWRFAYIWCRSSLVCVVTSPPSSCL
ncbi:hypothetical protein GQ44DRAFT_718049, partial [Phaeosphaeriaceae sp. PMI808]